MRLLIEKVRSMTDIYQGFRFKTQDDAFEAGFTLIELLIVIVVLVFWP